VTNTDTAIIDIMPVITGLVVDDLLINASVKLLTFPEQEFIVESQTDSDGRYNFQQASLPEHLIIEVTGGTHNGEDFLGTLTGFCLLSERLSCDITPISTLIMSYAERENILEDGDKPAWIEQLDSALAADLTTDPFIDESNTSTDIEKIRSFLQNGEQLNKRVETVLDFDKNGAATKVINDVRSREGRCRHDHRRNRRHTRNCNFPNANIPPVVTAATFTVDENSADGTAVGTVAATDLDGDSLAWAIIGGNAGTPFAIDSSSGDITVADDTQLDYETTSSYSLTVEVSDGTNTGSGTIAVDLSDLTDLTISDASVTEGGSDSTLTFTLTIDNIQNDASVDYATSDDTAENADGDGDYEEQTGTITFVNDSRSETITIFINGDSTVEADESFTLTLSN
ncbi:MAG: hypothetical protein GY829_12070, partial [Gammaproteobacteria bacterium]|nr:hypothetical protein [Gammaproteobacteria bacterium]